jgi:hypothetical protein
VITSKTLKSKYEALYKILASFNLTHDIQVRAVEYSVKGIQHAQADVRNPAYECMGELYK